MIVLLLLVATQGAEVIPAPSEGVAAPVFSPAIEAPAREDQAASLGVSFGQVDEDCNAAFPLTRKNVPLTSALREKLVAAGHGKALKRRHLAVSVVDLTPGTRIHYAGINDDTMLYAASLAKIAAVLSVAQGAKESRIKWDAAVTRDAALAIRWSNNEAATRLVKRATLPYIEEVLRRPGYCFFNNDTGGLWLGRGYGGSREESRDPVQHTVHGANSRQIARFYTMLDKGLLVGPIGNGRILQSMGPPEGHRGFVGVLEASGARIVARKSGAWRNFHADSALVEHAGARYVVVAMSDLPEGSKAVEDVARVVDQLIRKGAHRSPAVTGTRP